MKSFTNREQYRIQTSEPIKFKKIKHEEQKEKDKNAHKTKVERAFLQDKENMYEKIQELKEENGELSQIVKIQQTQINYYKVIKSSYRVNKKGWLIESARMG